MQRTKGGGTYYVLFSIAYLCCWRQRRKILMKKNSQSKIIKILIISISLLLTLTAGVWIPVLLQSTEAWEQDEYYSDTPEVNQTEDNQMEENQIEENQIEVNPTEVNQIVDNEHKKAVLAELEVSEVIEIIEEVKIKSKTELEAAETMDWIDQRIMETGAEVAPEDLEDFRLIVGMLDMSYVEGLVKEGLNETSLEELRSYLYAQLGGQYYQRAKELFQTYQHLLYVE